MVEKFKGKALIRRSGEWVIICGVFIPSEQLENYDDRDELWAVEILVSQAKKFVNAKELTFSPEDFLSNTGDCQDINRWQEKNFSPKGISNLLQ